MPSCLFRWLEKKRSDPQTLLFLFPTKKWMVIKQLKHLQMEQKTSVFMILIHVFRNSFCHKLTINKKNTNSNKMDLVVRTWHFFYHTSWHWLLTTQDFDLPPNSRLLAVLPVADGDLEQSDTFSKKMSLRGSAPKECGRRALLFLFLFLVLNNNLSEKRLKLHLENS